MLIQNKALVKTEKFKAPKYVGDPLNAVKIFNEKAVDELVIFDIDASSHGREPNFALIEKLAMQCRMPLCYGGGVSSVSHAKRLISLGVEKIAISTAALKDWNFLSVVSQEIGQQSVVLVLDVKKNFFGKYKIMMRNGTDDYDMSLDEVLWSTKNLNIGELIINSIDKDGTLTGYDMKLIRYVRNIVDCPLTVLGGASSQDNIVELVRELRVIGAGVGSLFVFKGQYKAVLIGYMSEKYMNIIRHLN